jgi:3-deoxy-D-manno-oct-2-ulosonic acid (Kdo) hydroxylase
MNFLFELETTRWNDAFTAQSRRQALQALEDGQVLYFPRLGFSIADAESRFLSPVTVGKSKNVSFDIATGKLAGSSHRDSAAEPLRLMMARFASQSSDLLSNLLPHYRTGLIPGRTSFRPVEVAGRSTSWRKDDTRLHIDSFPSSPVRDKRILRIFSNVNPHGQGRLWRLGDSFESVAQRFLPSLSRPVWGSSGILRALRITKSRRSAYDHFMLQLHDLMKADQAYQSNVTQLAQDFPPGSTWMAFTDQVSHAAMSGQYLLEQTFYLPVGSMLDPSKSPLRILERLTNWTLT